MEDAPAGYTCCFCAGAITPEDESSAVVLTATRFKDWQEGAAVPARQSFWAHSICLQKEWSGYVAWERDVLYELQ
jgi:hypothetical protein